MLASGAGAQPFDWRGLYLGASVGGVLPQPGAERLLGVSGETAFGRALYPPSFTRAGVLAGAQLGYNWQTGRWVWGLETDFGLLDGRRAPHGVFAAPAGVYSLEAQAGADYFASLRARFGFTADRALFYVTGGVAAGGARGPGALTLGASDRLTAGWSQSSRGKYALGAGVEYAFADAWSARGEYVFLSQSLNTQAFGNESGAYYVSRLRNDNHLLRFGLNYHFGARNEIPGSVDYGKRDVDGDGAPDSVTAERYSVHAQTTNVLQAYPRFRAAYDGPASFPSGGKANVGSTTNIFLGLRLWEGAAAYLNPEVDVGYGLANSVGAAAYVNGAVAKLGRTAPYLRFQRYFLRQIIGLDGGARGRDPDEGSLSEVLESVQNQIAGPVDRDRIVITLGKFAVGDVFDDNIYAHDPTTGFMNFAFNTLGAFDYAADAWGYTHGLAVEWKQNWWTARGGVFQLSSTPNGPDIEPQLLRQFMGVGEFEARYDLLGQPGALKFLAYGDNGYFGNVQDVVRLAVASNDLPPQLDALHRRHLKMGGGVNLKQQLMPGLGFFMRASLMDGRYETVDYTDVDRQISAGVVADGALWSRSDDEVGVAVAAGGLTDHRVRYFELGGRSVYIGDGRLSYAGEKNLEAYYKLGFGKNMDATFDYQLLVHPGHNAARGPINVFGLRLRAAF